MCYHMPLYYLMAGGTQQIVHRLTNAPLHYQFPATNPQWGISPALFAREENGNIWQVTEPATLFALRILSILVGSVLVISTYLVAENLFHGEAFVGVMAATLVAGWPQYLFMSRAISNDILASALAAAVLTLLLLKHRPYRFLLASLLTGLAILTKLNMVFILAPLAVTLVLEFLDRDSPRSTYLHVALSSAIILLIPAVAIAAHPTLRAHYLQTTTVFANVRPDATQLSYWLDVGRMMLRSGWAYFGWMNVPAPTWQSVVWWSFIAVGLTIGGIKLVRKPPAGWKWQQFTPFAIILIWFAACSLTFVRINLNRFQPQFRFLFSLIPLLTSLTAGGILALTPPDHRVRLGLVMAMAAVLLAANLWILLSVVIPVYS